MWSGGLSGDQCVLGDSTFRPITSYGSRVRVEKGDGNLLLRAQFSDQGLSFPFWFLTWSIPPQPQGRVSSTATVFPLCGDGKLLGHHDDHHHLFTLP